ncbi:unnamed protein product [Mycena citricolor]|uniref:Uncharacterized protein n=1 Tax=Mycena citricolor TaxID=2018698 RepID=A0AAD2HZ13_9AGAR|nr:unnamed protein product [Mycena citricolor]
MHTNNALGLHTRASPHPCSTTRPPLARRYSDSLLDLTRDPDAVRMDTGSWAAGIARPASAQSRCSASRTPSESPLCDSPSSFTQERAFPSSPSVSSTASQFPEIVPVRFETQKVDAYAHSAPPYAPLPPILQDGGVLGHVHFDAYSPDALPSIRDVFPFAWPAHTSQTPRAPPPPPPPQQHQHQRTSCARIPSPLRNAMQPDADPHPARRAASSPSSYTVRLPSAKRRSRRAQPQTQSQGDERRRDRAHPGSSTRSRETPLPRVQRVNVPAEYAGGYCVAGWPSSHSHYAPVPVPVRAGFVPVVDAGGRVLGWREVEPVHAYY